MFGVSIASSRMCAAGTRKGSRASLRLLRPSELKGRPGMTLSVSRRSFPRAASLEGAPSTTVGTARRRSVDPRRRGGVLLLKDRRLRGRPRPLLVV